jgi:hypothetical protein
MPNNTSDRETPDSTNTTELPVIKENAFMLYAVFCGDVARTAHALAVDEDVVRALATTEGWDRKLKPIIDLKNSTRAGDVERAINRAINFVDAHRYRLFLGRVLRELSGMSYSDLKAFLFPETDEKGSGGLVKTKRFQTRSLADLAAAMEKCHAMTYIALNDTATERKERDETDDGEASASEMHVKLAQAMASAGKESKSQLGMVLDAQLQIANDLSPAPILPTDTIKPSS